MFIRTQSSGYNERFKPLKGKAGLIPTLKSSENAEMKTIQSGHVHKQLETTTLRRMTFRCQMTLTFIQGTHPTPYMPLRSVISYSFTIISEPAPESTQPPIPRYPECRGPWQRRRYSDSLLTGRYGDRIPVGATFSAPAQTGPRAHPDSHTTRKGSFPRVKRPGRGVNHPSPPSAEVKERLELHPYSSFVPSLHVIGWTSPVTFYPELLPRELCDQGMRLTSIKGQDYEC